MKKLFDSTSKKIAAVLAGLTIAAGFAFAAATYNFGYNSAPGGGTETFHGAFVDGSAATYALPTIVQAGQTISAQVGGQNAGAWVATGTTTAAGTLTFPVAVPTNRTCVFTDITTLADTVKQTTAVSTTVVTIAGTIVSGDTITYLCNSY